VEFGTEYIKIHIPDLAPSPLERVGVRKKYSIN